MCTKCLSTGGGGAGGGTYDKSTATKKKTITKKMANNPQMNIGDISFDKVPLNA